MDATARRAFESTVLGHVDSLFGAALRLTRSRAEAEDLVQETLVRAYRFWASFRPGSSVRAWVFTILRNTFITRYHRQGRERALAEGLEQEFAAVGEGPIAAPPSPEAATSQLHLREEIDAALQRLPPDYRMAVVLADIEGLSYKEIAEAMECPIGTVMSRIHRGRRQLHSLLYRHAVDAGLAEEPEAPVSLDAYRNRAASARS
ncbi:sigma-70 family RNA polymerase sigma factor [Nannocystis pusilla]|uniref:sigma-70 family RNA polymerase sigma factor n=1 Tax=Nannocystis pusilla TaxID=889268 RepID=UPI003BF14BBE